MLNETFSVIFKHRASLNMFFYRIEFEKAKKNSSYVPISSKELDIKREMRIQKYYDTHRSRDFQHDHWKHELSNETLREIMTEPLCQKVLKILNYPL